MTEQLSPLTSTRASVDHHREAVLTYHMMRVAREHFHSSLSVLNDRQLIEVKRKAEHSLKLENLVLASPEALGVVIMPKHVDPAVGELAAGYPDTETFVVDLEFNGLTMDSLGLAIRRAMVFDAVMQRVGARHLPVDPIDEQAYYERHRDDFTTPERRTARQLLIAVNSDDPESRRTALRRLVSLVAQITTVPPQSRARRFGTLACQHSSCSTADQGGRLGDLVRGQLDPRLDGLLFSLPEGALGGPVETELGFHLIYCEHIHSARTQPFSEARDSIRALLIERRRRDSQASWIATLRQPGH
jgi:peptidyl-prolyl cis-trans isomerase C